MTNELKQNRIWELDFFRGVALIFMIYFHVIFDLSYIYNFDVSFSSGINYLIGKASVILFILISAISCGFSRSNFKRGLMILGLGMAITVVTGFLGPGFIVKFGVLHFLGVSIIMFPLFRRLNKYWLIALGTLIIIAGFFTSRVTAASDYLFIVGIISSKFTSSDYYPLIPWFGVFLYGMSLGKILYTQRKSIFRFNMKDNIISTMGRRTLFLYMIHQPVILVVLELVKRLEVK